MSHLEAAKRFLDRRRQAKDGVDGGGHVLNVLIPPTPRPDWPTLAAQRWGPAVGDPTPGIVIDRPDPARRAAVLEVALGELLPR